MAQANVTQLRLPVPLRRIGVQYLCGAAPARIDDKCGRAGAGSLVACQVGDARLQGVRAQRGQLGQVDDRLAVDERAGGIARLTGTGIIAVVIEIDVQCHRRVSRDAHCIAGGYQHRGRQGRQGSPGR